MAGKAIRSGFITASVLGATSANMRITKVRMIAAMVMALSPNKRMARIVVMEEARILTKLLPSKIMPDQSGFRTGKKRGQENEEDQYANKEADG